METFVCDSCGFVYDNVDKTVAYQGGEPYNLCPNCADIEGAC